MSRSLILLFVTMIIGDRAIAQWTPQPSGTKARLRGVCSVSEDIAWASGTEGTFVRTTDGGTIWHASRVPGGEALDFRDVHALDANTAHLLSIGDGEKSRLYKTIDSGKTWKLTYLNHDPKVFLDTFAFWDAATGIALGDPVDGRFVILTTRDGGESWQRPPSVGMPPALPGEGAFAASGTCLIVRGEDAWFGTGGGRVARVFHSTDWGKTWTVHETPIRADGPTAGVFSLAFRDASHGVAVGGDYKLPEQGGTIAAWTEDGGRSWRLAETGGPPGYRSAVAALPGPAPRYLAVGPSGSDLSEDGGKTWKSLGREGFHALSVSPEGVVWAVGEEGRVSRFRGPAE